MTAVTMEQLSAGVQKIFADAVKGTPSLPVEPEKYHTLPNNSNLKSSYVTQHNISTTVLSGRKEGRKEGEFDKQPRGA
jgi:hypothetical protein